MVVMSAVCDIYFNLFFKFFCRWYPIVTHKRPCSVLLLYLKFRLRSTVPNITSIAWSRINFSWIFFWIQMMISMEAKIEKTIFRTMSILLAVKNIHTLSKTTEYLKKKKMVSKFFLRQWKYPHDYAYLTYWTKVVDW